MITFNIIFDNYQIITVEDEQTLAEVRLIKKDPARNKKKYITLATFDRVNETEAELTITHDRVRGKDLEDFDKKVFLKAVNIMVFLLKMTVFADETLEREGVVYVSEDSDSFEDIDEEKEFFDNAVSMPYALFDEENDDGYDEDDGEFETDENVDGD